MAKILVTEVPCQDCDKVRLVKINGMLLESYCRIKPVCKSCGAKRAKDKMSKTWFTSERMKGNKNGFKKGYKAWNLKDENSYDAVHNWIERESGKAKYGACDKCGSNENLQWSNVSGQYKKEINDWQRFCIKCHQRYDWENFGARKVFYKGGNPIYG